MTLSGDCFIMQDLGPAAEKNFQSTATKCAGKTMCELCKWCETFTVHVKRFDKCIHPCHCFQKGIKDSKGFTVGDQVEDNVPSVFSTNIAKDDELMWDALTNLFDSGTSEHLTAQVNSG